MALSVCMPEVSCTTSPFSSQQGKHLCREMTREHSSSGQLAGPDGFDKWADPSATFRLHEGVSNPSRAEDQAHLHRLQKSSTKPRSGAWSHLSSSVTLRCSHCAGRTVVIRLSDHFLVSSCILVYRHQRWLSSLCGLIGRVALIHAGELLRLTAA